MDYDRYMIKESYHLNLYTSQINESKALKPNAIFDIFQLAAGMHAAKYSFDGPTIMHKGIIWLLVENKYEVVANLDSIYEIIVETRPIGNGKIKHLRDYIIYDIYGNTLIKGTSVWCLFDINKKTPIVDNEIKFIGDFYEKRAFDEPLEKIKIIEKEELTNIKSFEMNRSYYDVNNHVNNSFYAGFIYDCLDPSLNIESIKIDYVHQTFLNDRIDIFSTKLNENRLYFAGYVDDLLVFKAIIEVKNENK